MFRSSTINAIFLMAVTLMIAAPAAAAEETTGTPLKWFPYTAIFAVILTVLHLLGPQIRRILRGRESIVGSFGGGMAAAYVFVHLLPELDKSHAVFGRMIFLVALASFVVYYGAGKLIHWWSERQKVEGESPYLAYFRSLDLAIYNWLIVYGTPAEVAESGMRSLAMVVAMGLHLVHSDFMLSKEHPRTFDTCLRYVLALAPPVGWLTVVADQKTNETVNDFVVAVLAGTMLYGVFHEAIPEEREARFGWFLAGVVGFVTFVVLYLK